MNEAETIWRLGWWIGAGRTGTVRLRWTGGEAVLRTAGRQLTGFEGPAPECVAEAISMAPLGSDDLFREARELARKAGIPETRALMAVKVCLERALTGWLLDPDREIATDEVAEDGTPDDGGPTISLTHVMVELLLAAGEGSELTRRVLPDDDIVLCRTPGFLERYAALQLAEEADLVVARVTDGRSVGDVIARSSHGADDVRRLLAGLVAAGLLETVRTPGPEASSDSDPASTRSPDVPDHSVSVPEVPAARNTDLSGPAVRRLPWPWILLAAAVLVVVLAVGAYWYGHRPPKTDGARMGRTWGIVVDMGCEAVDYERILRKVRKHPRRLRAVRTGGGAGDGGCWRLVWGRYETKEAADEAARSIPADALAEGFEPHVVELDRNDVDAGGSPSP